MLYGTPTPIRWFALVRVLALYAHNRGLFAGASFQDSTETNLAKVVGQVPVELRLTRLWGRSWDQGLLDHSR